ncbi:hypothetical protein FXV83_15840 [Bradyrhizobium hipponense]|uniref:Uncharacterized protein n=1 Tax=Bradyrhizobium hipponense TaxID=2605638 RepID=A0A5S4YLY1_9BRAD|nr:hypothetical protein [Bradyrhizobium hipponense]TYO65406.1 hypothetical protein FXV83_15840 [Bradyrhizobium hipponense]
MTKIANSFYSAAVQHKEIDGLYHATFGIPGQAPEWVNGKDGKPDTFRDHNQAVLAGFRVMVAKLNRARQEQDFHVKGQVNGRQNTIKSWKAPVEKNTHSIESVFGKK